MSGGGGGGGMGGGGGSSYDFRSYTSDPRTVGNWNTGGQLAGHGSMDNGIRMLNRGPTVPGIVDNLGASKYKRVVNPGLLAKIQAFIEAGKPMRGPARGGKFHDRMGEYEPGYNYNVVGGHGVQGYGTPHPSMDY